MNLENEYVLSLLYISGGLLVLVIVFLTAAGLGAWGLKLGSMHLDKSVFGKRKLKAKAEANEEEESNLVPLEEALMINDHKSVRELVMNVIKDNSKNSLAAISLALDSTDSETSHYAAAALSRELGEIRLKVQKLLRDIRIQKEEHPGEKSELIRFEHMLFDYLYEITGYRVFTNAEQQSFILELEHTAERLYVERELGVKEQSALSQLLLDSGAYERAGIWCLRARQEDPKSLAAYKCMLKYLFLTRRREEFFETLNSLKTSGINIDGEMLDIVRTF